MLGESNRLYQASSIHARQRMSPRTSYIDTGSPLPTPPPPPATNVLDQRTEREKRLIADLWLTSAATFRRMGKLEQARAAIQEAETLDEGNPGLWVQVCQNFRPLWFCTKNWCTDSSDFISLRTETSLTRYPHSIRPW